MSARRNGIIIKIPSNAPSTPTIMTRVNSKSNPRIMMAGMVTPTPKAMDSPAEPAVWTMLFSKMLASLRAFLDFNRNRHKIITATGMEAFRIETWPLIKTKSR